MKILAPISSVLILIACFVLVPVEGNFFTDLFNPGLDHSPSFSGSQLYLLDSNDMGLDDTQGFVGCFGDFNSDKFTDLFVISGNDTDTMVNVYLWNTEHWQFEESSTASIAVPYITNVAAGDFNYDGKLDLLVSGFNITNNHTYVKIFIGDLSKFDPEPISELSAASQVEIIDSNNDLKLDLFGEIWVSETNGTSGNGTAGNGTEPTNTTVTTVRRRVFWINRGDGTFNMEYDSYQAPLRVPHSNAFVDLNGDCLADRFVTSTDENGNPQYEVWINQKTKGYSLHSVMPLPQGAGQITFSDFDRDGNLDFIIPVCHPQPSCSRENSIYVVSNQQKGLCSLLKKSANCRSSTDLCSADPNFKLGQINVSSDPLVTIIPTSILNQTGTFNFNNELGRPLVLRVGDYNLDGFPDLMIPLTRNGTSHVELWANVAGNGGRTFVRVDGGTDDLEDIPNAYAGAFFDLDEDGVSDMIILADNPPRIECVYNNFDNDAFFLKALGLNGVCPEWCPSKPKFPSPKPYGVNYVGGVFKFTYTDLSGKSILQTGTQLPQSSYLSLYTPYILFGLGRTSNYIEQFFFGAALNQSTHFNYWTGSTIPNSQVVAVPYKPDNPSGWTLELYITPSGLLFWIMIALIVSLLVLSIVVCVFYRKEKKEDELKKQEQAHLFSFDAL